MKKEEGQVQNVVNNQPVETPAGLNMNNVGVAAANLVLNEQGNPANNAGNVQGVPDEEEVEEDEEVQGLTK